MIDNNKERQEDEEMCNVPSWTQFADPKEERVDDRKRKRLSLEERKQRSRERNRLHARKTRERKKLQMEALQQRMQELKEEGKKLRHMVDERNTVIILLGLNGRTPLTPALTTIDYGDLDRIDAKDNSNLDKLLSHLGSLSGTRPSLQLPGIESNDDDSSENRSVNGNCDGAQDSKQPRKRGKYSPKERQRIRRERNRMHAKRTRDRKKLFLEASELIVHHLEKENGRLVEFLEKTNDTFGDYAPTADCKRSKTAFCASLIEGVEVEKKAEISEGSSTMEIGSEGQGKEDGQDTDQPLLKMEEEKSVTSLENDPAKDLNEELKKENGEAKEKENSIAVYSNTDTFSRRPVYPWIMNMA